MQDRRGEARCAGTVSWESTVEAFKVFNSYLQKPVTSVSIATITINSRLKVNESIEVSIYSTDVTN